MLKKSFLLFVKIYKLLENILLTTKKVNTGLPYTQGNQGNSGNLKVIENLKETQGSFKIIKSQEFFFLDLE